MLCREQLELLEDKLRDFKSLRDNQYDDKVLPYLTLKQQQLDEFARTSQALLTHSIRLLQTVALSQLDSLRRELIACARDRLEFLVFTKVPQVCKKHWLGLYKICIKEA